LQDLSIPILRTLETPQQQTHSDEEVMTYSLLQQGESQKWRPVQCIPKATVTPKYEILSDWVGTNVQFVKYHTIIGKLWGILPTERDLIAWINSQWKPASHFELKLESKVFFYSFQDQKDRERIFENGQYFFCSAGLDLRY
jgi:hypothetical protein